MGSVAGCSEPAFDSAEEDSGAPDAAAESECARGGCELGDAGAPPSPDAARPKLDLDGAPASPSEAGTVISMADGAEPGSDAGGALVPPQRDGAEALLGTYAMRAHFYGYQLSTITGDRLSSSTHERLAIAEITRADSGMLLLTMRLCHDVGSATGLGAAVLGIELMAPERYPTRQLRVSVQGDRFEAVGEASLAGYDLPLPENCSPGATVTREPPQPGLSSRCECPRTMGVPASPTDCRVSDPDQDGRPGITVNYSGLFNTSDSICLRDGSRLLEGKVDFEGGQHTAQYEIDETFYQITCANGGCTRPNSRACVPAANPVWFARLKEKAGGQPWTCAELAREWEHVVPGRPLGFPDESCRG